jgi:hypothetical protein
VSDPRPCTPVEAVQRARTLLADVSNQHNGYQLGTGSYHPLTTGGHVVDVPWTQRTDASGQVHVGSDCAGFAMSWVWKLPRHRPGFNAGPWATVADDINTDSGIEDAEHNRDLFCQVVGAPQPGDMLVYKTIALDSHPGMRWIGHVGLVLDASGWDGKHYHSLVIAQCKGPNGRMPGVVQTDGSVWDHHDATWNRPQWATRVLRIVP